MPTYGGFAELAAAMGAAAPPAGPAAVAPDPVCPEPDPADAPGLRALELPGVPADAAAAFAASGDRLSGADSPRERRAGAAECVALLASLAPGVDVKIGAGDAGALTFAADAALFPPLGPPYAFQGGVARRALALAAGAAGVGSAGPAVRDVDVARLAAGPDRAADDALARRLMRDDWHAAGVTRGPIRASPSPAAYFRTRDLTVNEVLLRGGEVSCTPLGLCDFLGGVVRPTEFHRRQFRGRVSGLIACKAVRFVAQERAAGRPARLGVLPIAPPPRGARPGPGRVAAFPLALHFARALRHGPGGGGDRFGLPAGGVRARADPPGLRRDRPRRPPPVPRGDGPAGVVLRAVTRPRTPPRHPTNPSPHELDLGRFGDHAGLVTALQ